MNKFSNFDNEAYPYKQDDNNNEIVEEYRPKTCC